MNPNVRNSAVTVTNGIKYPGDVSGAPCFESDAFVFSAINCVSRFPVFLWFKIDGCSIFPRQAFPSPHNTIREMAAGWQSRPKRSGMLLGL
jgi:hypothetical protein